MEGKEGRCQRAGPETMGHLPQDQEQEHGGGGVQQHVGQMVSSRIESIHLAIEHVGEASQRNPVAQLEIGEGPANTVESQAASHLGIRIDGNTVIVAEEREAGRLNEHQRDGRQQDAANGQRQNTGFGRGASFRTPERGPIAPLSPQWGVCGIREFLGFGHERRSQSEDSEAARG